MPSISTAAARRTSGAACPTCWPRSRTICASWAGSRSAVGFRGRGAAGLRLPRKPRHVCASGLSEACSRADGSALPGTGDAILFFPSGAAGPAFLVTENFVVIKQFNNSDAYALAVGELADRLHGLRQSAPPGRPTISSRRASSASRSSASSPLSAIKSVTSTATSISTCATTCANCRGGSA